MLSGRNLLSVVNGITQPRANLPYRDGVFLMPKECNAPTIKSSRSIP